MNEEKLVPKLRFSEFNDEWIEINIKDYSTIKGRIGWRNLKQSEYTESGPYLIAGKHITNGIINWEECDHLSMERYDESPEIALKIGDVIFSKDGSLGNPALIRELPDKATINGTMMLVRLHEKVTPNFFYQVLNSESFFRLLHILKSGSSIPHIFQRDMENFKFKIPQSLEEQNMISSLLETVDEKIELLNKKYQTYQNFKQYLMQQIFTQKLRFTKFDDEWKSVKLGDFLTFYSTNSFSREKLNYESGNVKNIHYGDIHTKFPTILSISGNNEVPYINTNIDLSKYKEEQYLQEGDLIIADASEDYADIGKSIEVKDINDEKVLAGLHTILARDEKNLTINGFKGYLFLTEDLKTNIKRIANGISVLGLSKNNLSKLSVNIPSKNEQQEIVNLFSSIDKKIELFEYEYKKAQEFKKGLLQQMFV